MWPISASACVRKIASLRFQGPSTTCIDCKTNWHPNCVSNVRVLTLQYSAGIYMYNTVRSYNSGQKHIWVLQVALRKFPHSNFILVTIRSCRCNCSFLHLLCMIVSSTFVIRFVIYMRDCLLFTNNKFEIQSIFLLYFYSKKNLNFFQIMSDCEPVYLELCLYML